MSSTDLIGLRRRFNPQKESFLNLDMKGEQGRQRDGIRYTTINPQQGVITWVKVEQLLGHSMRNSGVIIGTKENN